MAVSAGLSGSLLFMAIAAGVAFAYLRKKGKV